MMKHYAPLAILMAALTFAVSCNKEKRYNGPSTLPKEKISESTIGTITMRMTSEVLYEIEYLD